MKIMIDLNKFSPENLIKIQKVLKIVLDEIEFQPIAGVLGTFVDIPVEKFEKEGIYRSGVESIFYKINERDGIVNLPNFSEFTATAVYQSEAEKISAIDEQKLREEKYISIWIANIDNLKKLEKIKLAVDEKITKYKKLKSGAIKNALKNIVKKADEEEKAQEVQLLKGKVDGLEKLIKTVPEAQRPHCIGENGIGYLQFGRYGGKIEIGGDKNQPFKLLQCLTEPFETAKPVETVFEAIRENIKKKSKSGVYTAAMDRKQKIKLIGYAIKELQKGKKLKGKLKFKWDDLETKLWLEYMA